MVSRFMIMALFRHCTVMLNEFNVLMGLVGLDCIIFVVKCARHLGGQGNCSSTGPRTAKGLTRCPSGWPVSCGMG